MKFQMLGDFLGIKTYGAVEGKFSFVVSYTEGLGWTASFKDREFTGKQSSHVIGTVFQTRDQAETACRHELKRLKKQ